MRKYMTITRQRMRGKKRVEDMTDEEAQTLATLIDTQGSIYVAKDGMLGISLGGRSIMPVNIAELWGGMLYKDRTGSQKRLRYIWRITEIGELRPILQKTMPYLKLRLEQAKTILELCDVLDAKAEGWKDKVQELRVKVRELQPRRSTWAYDTQDIDIAKLEGAII